MARALGIALAVVLVVAWLGRERIADDVIASQLDSLGLPATYEVESIGPQQQVLSHIVIGDPARPDMTVERAEVSIEPRFGIPALGTVRLVRPRIYGTYRDGKLSFGSLDKVLFAESPGEPFRMPDLDLVIVDGRALLETDHGAVGVKLAGVGSLRHGFTGELAALAPAVAIGECVAGRTSLYGTLRVLDEKPRFVGPLRLGKLDCPAQGMHLAASGMQLDLTMGKQLDSVEGRLGLRGGALAHGANRLAGATGTAAFSWRKQLLTARYNVAGQGAATPQARAGEVALDGTLRAASDFARFDIESEVRVGGLMPGADLDAALGSAADAAKDTLAAPLLGRFRAALKEHGEGSTLAGSLRLRGDAGSASLMVPRAVWRSAQGEALAALSRVQATGIGGSEPRLSGNFSTGGEGLPRLSGRMEQNGRGLMMRVSMGEYSAGTASVALPDLTIAQGPGGALGFAGKAVVSGDLPGGFVRNLHVPVEGNWSARGGLAVWRRCADVRFDSLRIADFTVDRRQVTLCPPRGGAIVRQGDGGLRIAAGAPSLDLSGRLGETPLRIRSGALGFAVPGNLAARSLDVALGPAQNASHFRIANLSARIGKDVSGRFAGADVLLAAVPMDLVGAEGDWRFADGRLTLADAAFTVRDREQVRRFAPLVAKDGALLLVDNRIAATATLLEPNSLRTILRTDIVHDLSSGKGNAGLSVPGILFDKELQPDTLTPMALGVIANAMGEVRGTGRIDWNADAVTSSGHFMTDSLDFAAAFGPAAGASGTIEFTDLLGFVTAPDQKLHVASINPGIEVNNGTITYALRPNSQLVIKEGVWPFLGGTLRLEPTVMNFGVAETRYYTLSIKEADAAKLVQRMDLANISVTGVFDGSVPLVFDENGGRIDRGTLQSRAPGGNVSYVGELTYEDLSFMANFAFETLRSIDYRHMSVELEGPLEGEIITRLKFDGIRQGTGARANFLTKRIARLPIRFNVNITAPFFQLATSVRSMYDPAYVRDPRSLGLIDREGRPLSPSATGTVDIQPSESGAVP
ncbi:MAG: YdbH domain-containing protein [Novosphingobium sp.]|nr:YdbH domain-containing protein [Novosphingobium sp.]